MDVCPQGWGGEEVKNKGARGSIWGERQHCFLNVVVTQLSVKTLNRMSFTGCPANMSQFTDSNVAFEAMKTKG